MALTKVLTDHEQAMQLQSPRGFMLHGEVGTGKSMLIDLFQDCLPHAKKQRWHFNTFMLDTLSRLEKLRMSRSLMTGPCAGPEEYSLLLVAKDLIERSPILFLDEFQLPDRAASKILPNLLTSFFQLGGVLITTSNRMPEELAKAAGMEFARPVNKLNKLEWSMGKKSSGRRDEGAGQLGEFSAFLEVLRARCEIWEMEGKNDYRKLEREQARMKINVQAPLRDNLSPSAKTSRMGSADNAAHQQNMDSKTNPTETGKSSLTVVVPKYYLIQATMAKEMGNLTESLNVLVERATRHTYPIPWEPASLRVYRRTITISAQYNGVAFFTFEELCGATLGPADYITLASTYHTFILTDVPVMCFLNKNEARRFITLLDAMYEARCRLLVVAVTGPDDLFFPEPRASSLDYSASTPGKNTFAEDAVHSETFSEIYQDLNSPFRPNASSYHLASTPSLAEDALEDGPPNRTRREGASDTDERSGGTIPSYKAPNFADIRGLTGEDEGFAIKRAESRIWEMCSERWWDRGCTSGYTSEGEGRVDVNVQEWWRPLPMESRHWQNSSGSLTVPKDEQLPPNVKILSRDELERDSQREVENLFTHGASPFRTHPDAPPQFSWTHAWGMMRWGKKAGAWGLGPEGLGNRVKAGGHNEQAGDRQEDREKK